MKLLAATILSFSIVASAANGQQTIIGGVKTMPTTEDIRAVAPALDKYAKDVVHGDLWKRPGLPPRDRSIVTVAALIARDQTVELPYYLNLALDNGVKPAELSEIITHLAFYTGWANAMDAVAAAKDVFKSRNIGSARTSFRPHPVPSFPSTKRRRRSGRRVSASSSARSRPAWSSIRQTCCSAISG
ncbi:alkylhydroperoxidase/carboxymuconolactone decarboxylase family protein YurZ [Bradyrhizobium sp. i1.4.4]